MREQLDLFAWADARPSNVIDVMPALIRKAAMEPAIRLPRVNGDGVVTLIRKTG